MYDLMISLASRDYLVGDRANASGRSNREARENDDMDMKSLISFADKEIIISAKTILVTANFAVYVSLDISEAMLSVHW